MPDNNEQVGKAELEQESRHRHLCLLYESEAEILTPVIPFIQKGIALSERCIYLNAGEEMLERVLTNVAAAQKHDTGALVLLPAQQSWLQDDGFSAQRVLGLLESLCVQARDDGFQGTRIICDMGWAAARGAQDGLLLEFELELNCFAAAQEVSLLCLYNRRRFPERGLLALARVHQQLVIGGRVCSNPCYVPQDQDPAAGSSELDLFLQAVQIASGAENDRERLRQEREEAYAALARKIYESWQEEDSLRASEKELQEKDEALLEQRRRLQTVLQHLPAMMMAFDAGNRLAACNHEFERVTGFRAEEVMGKTLVEILEIEAEGREEAVLAHPPEGGDYRGRYWKLRCKDGSARGVSWSNFSRYVPIAGWPNWAIGLDQTPAGETEQVLRGLRDELQLRTGKLEALGRVVTHELAGQIHRISGQCSVLQELYAETLSPPCREILREIHQGTVEVAGRITALRKLVPATGGARLRADDRTRPASGMAERTAAGRAEAESGGVGSVRVEGECDA